MPQWGVRNFSEAVKETEDLESLLPCSPSSPGWVNSRLFVASGGSGKASDEVFATG